MIDSPEQKKTDEIQQAPLFLLPRDVLTNVIGPYLGLQGRSRMARSCRQLHGFFQSGINKVRLMELQTAVLTCKASDIANILEANPYLLLQKSTTTDGAGRTFQNCSPLQNAIWSMAWILWPLLLNYLPKEKYFEALKQILELEDMDREHGAHYDATPLINALRNYAQRCRDLDYDNHPTPEKEAELTHLWCKGVGQPQRIIPMALVLEYCSGTGPFFLPEPRYNENDVALPNNINTEVIDRRFSVLRPPIVPGFPMKKVNSTDFYWFPLPKGLGDVFAISGWLGGCGWGACPGAFGIEFVSCVDAKINLVAVTTWYEAATKKLLALKQTLQNPALLQEIVPTRVPTL
jgi:hypothetical protein